MSQPIRYGLAYEHLGRIHPAKDGHLVMWADYAALAAENEKLINGLNDQGAALLRLSAENERLRKACELVFGEAAKRKFLRCYPGNDFYVSLEAMEEMKNALGWNAAKEGSDAK